MNKNQLMMKTREANLEDSIALSFANKICPRRTQARWILLFTFDKYFSQVLLV